jgi:hypothetical protein
MKNIFFLETEEGTKYGSFGYCEATNCTNKRVGYDNGPEITEWLTKTQVLFGIGECVLLGMGSRDRDSSRGTRALHGILRASNAARASGIATS